MIERYTRPAMGRIWTLENRYRAWLAVEVAVCEAWAELGRVPAEAVKTIREKADIDVDRILEIEQTTRHDVIAFLTSLEEKVGPDARYIHLGCTSSDIVDTANGYLFMQAGKLIVEDIEKVLASLEALARKHKGVLCMGRTHGIHAEPTSFGLKMTGFHTEFQRHLERVKAGIESVRVGKISGAVGTYAFLSPELEEKALTRLGLAVDPHSTQIVQRDRYAHFFTSLAILAGGIERLCVELRHLQRTEVLEVEEGFAKGQKGSSAMPHKKNPISAENMAGLARLIRVIMPDSTILADYVLNRLCRLLDGLVVKPERMKENMERSYGLYFSQRVLTALIATGLPRQKAYEAVQRLAMQSWETRKPFPELVCADPDMHERLGDAQLAELFDPTYYLKYEDVIYKRVFGN